METLFAIGMMVGLMKSHTEPPKVAAPVEQRYAEQRHVERHPPEQRKAELDRSRPSKKSEWPLSY